MTKDERNEISYYKFKEAGFRGTLIAPPRYGKTSYALNIILRIYNKFKSNLPSCMIIVRNVAVKQQWEYEKNKLVFEKYTDVRSFGYHDFPHIVRRSAGCLLLLPSR